MYLGNLLSTVLVGSSYCATAYAAVMAEPMIEGKKAAHSYHLLDLDTKEISLLGNDTNASEGSLEERTQVSRWHCTGIALPAPRHLFLFDVAPRSRPSR